MTACSSPLAYDVLVDWWACDLDDRRTATIEEHLFSCDSCAARSESLGRLIGGLRDAIPPVISHAHRERLVRSRKTIVSTPVDASVLATARFAPGVDLLVHELRCDLSGAERVDVEVLAPDGSVGLAFDHVTFDADRGEVLVACQRHYQIFHVDDSDPVFRVHVTKNGRRRVVGDYIVHHIWE